MDFTLQRFEKIRQIHAVRVRPQTMQLYTRTRPANEKTRPKPRFLLMRTT
ncbi:hypothetical protein PFWH6_4967 [Pseudomonas fluorescens WH6]|nr:hypothetical protein PFWH6_4967 [Pseudomonas fluorescens WH6]